MEVQSNNAARMSKENLSRRNGSPHPTVDDFGLWKPPASTNRNTFQRRPRNRFSMNRLQTADFNKLWNLVRNQGLQSAMLAELFGFNDTKFKGVESY